MVGDKIKSYRFSILMLFVLVTSQSLAQQGIIISGSVTDKEGVLPGATVFLTGTKEITVTNDLGSFQFRNIVPGNYQLVVKMMGFNPFLKSITVTDEPVNLNVVLEPSIALLKEVIIRPNKEWFKNLEIFKKQFLGENENASKCKILNAERLLLVYNKKTHVLKASSDELLKIDNNALGYRITYLLANFEYSQKNNSVIYNGYPSFEILKGTNTQEALWKRNRENAYYGSIQHFLRAAYNGDIRKQGFVVYKLTNWVPGGAGYRNNIDSGEYKKRVVVDSLMEPINKSFKKMASKQALFVLYMNHEEDKIYKKAGYSFSQLFNDNRLEVGQVSVINVLSAGVAVDDRGSFFKPQDLFFEGYMGWQKISNLNPLGYTPLD
ncbi:carboxypeptidase-like regulatory domain-containing protein [Mucilaginibacter glaciei]|uniref:Carboxypeptidase-like regulatory domain-containing protein n=1 Tax=Mucilaginibacter glaciei TaxID=2772109 RepID=A0A926S4G6_9SPHI|nr:carboxypeptidase-like regulatory domain-containing protein [Mucilaginibacter glaciei]MBD1391766.1 carboxypeptidase-like regulatory domain-containing protein [Mucilaginibacter glaciei]